jgi:hypothetical protein
MNKIVIGIIIVVMILFLGFLTATGFMEGFIMG